jgi:site-specific recombinase XerD
MGIRDVDAYFEMRAPGLRRRSLKDVAERLRSLMRHLHRTGRTAVDLAPQIIAPMLYAYESIPSTLSSDQIATVLKSARTDQSPMGLRDYAILQLLSTYGLRVGEITHLRLEDIDWRAEILRIRHSKTSAHSLLPLMEPVGEALINYLRHGRPQTDAREIFIRSRAPYLNGLHRFCTDRRVVVMQSTRDNLLRLRARRPAFPQREGSSGIPNIGVLGPHSEAAGWAGATAGRWRLALHEDGSLDQSKNRVKR